MAALKCPHCAALLEALEIIIDLRHATFCGEAFEPPHGPCVCHIRVARAALAEAKIERAVL